MKISRTPSQSEPFLVKTIDQDGNEKVLARTKCITYPDADVSVSGWFPNRMDDSVTFVVIDPDIYEIQVMLVPVKAVEKKEPEENPNIVLGGIDG